MRGKLAAGGIVAVAALASLAGVAGARGGNHGCLPEERKTYESHFFKGGDHVIATYYQTEEGFPSTTTENLDSENHGTGLEFTSNGCGADPFTWTLFESELGPGDDSVRLDGVGLDGKYPAPPGPMPRRIASLLHGGPGDDVMRGHSGFDDMSGGGGADRMLPGGGRDRVLGGAGGDVIKAAREGKDNVQCGPGRDKAVVDKRDTVRGCERVRVVR
jgi:Ca2+-binding RTX toxin-like protein